MTSHTTKQRAGAYGAEVPPRGSDVRGLMRHLGGRTAQVVLTRLTGCALPDQTLPARSRLGLLARALAWYSTGVAGGCLVAPEAWWAYPIFWALTIHGARVLQVQMIHQAGHRTLVGSPGHARAMVNAALGHLLSVLIIAPYFPKYRVGHLTLHHPRHRLSTCTDPTVQYLRGLGIEPRQPRAVLWRSLLWALVSPVHHGSQCLERIGSHFVGTPWPYRVLLGSLLTAALGFVATQGAWTTLLLAWFVPLFPLYQASAALRLCVEHQWPAPKTPAGVDDAAELTRAVFCGSAPPAPTGPPWRRSIGMVVWLTKMAGHGLIRWMVLVGDTPCHDHHHLVPQSYDWANYEVARERARAQRSRLYREVWGLFVAIDDQFKALSATPLDIRVHREPSEREGAAS